MVKETILRAGYPYLLDSKEWVDYEVPHQERFFEAMYDILREGKKVMLDPDEDPDGLFSVKIFQEFFKKVDFHNYSINEVHEKQHRISMDAIHKAVREDYDYVIIVDSSSNLDHYDYALMTEAGVKVIVIDHHMITTERYVHENFLLLNNNDGEMPYSWVSAGYFIFILLKNLMDYAKPGRPFSDYVDLFMYGYITLISDSTHISNEMGAYITHYVRMYAHKAPALVRNSYVFPNQIISRGFLSFSFNNILNAAIRFNKFDVVYDYIYREQQTALKTLREIYKISAETRNSMVDDADVDIVGDIAVCNLTKFVEKFDFMTTKIMSNFTGYVANKIAEELSMPVLSYIELGGGRCKGSVRDPYSRNLLKIFVQLTEAGGHPPAFGLYFERMDLDGILNGFNQFSHSISEANDKGLILDFQNPNKFNSIQLSQMAKLNEIAGFDFPFIYLRVSLDRDTKVVKRGKVTTFKYGRNDLVAYDDMVGLADTLLVKPTYSKTIELIVEGVE